ncbi:MAG: hypothetical protein HC895_24505 [Leptolyngbyaceae cyanobacterium SM1_3_5]|nr:hypothetical protein [Leptolyngbyaceae cyanobacterium SM1_3_5]
MSASPIAKKAIAAAWFLLNVVINDRSMISDPSARCVVKNAIRKIAVTMLPSKLAAILLDRYKEATDLNQILCHFCINFDEIIQPQPDQSEVPLMIR